MGWAWKVKDQNGHFRDLERIKGGFKPFYFMMFRVNWLSMYFLFLLNSALEFLSTSKLSNLTVKAELGCCLLHRKGRLIIDGCVLQCESNPLDYLSCPIVCTASPDKLLPSPVKGGYTDGVSVSQTRIEGGAKAVLTSEDLALQHVRVIYTRTALFFWFDVEYKL